MEKIYHYLESAVINFKLNYCCWLAPVRIGIIIIGYFNLIAALVSLVGTANESFSPTIMKVQEIILEDNASKPIPILAYTTELAFSVLLLCGMYRNDIVLLRVYMYYTTATVITSILVYSMVIAVIDVLLTITVIFSIIFQVYMLLLLWSAIVEIRGSIDQNGDVKVAFNCADEDVKMVATKLEPDVEAQNDDVKVVYSSVKEEGKMGATKPVPDVVAPEETEVRPNDTPTEPIRKEQRDTKLETVEEEPKQSSNK
ncbi:uncharacterized protein ACR2FA_007212 [Aphomia sociella]